MSNIGWWTVEETDHVQRMAHTDAPWTLDLVAGRYHAHVFDLMAAFDFTACQFAWSADDGWVCMPDGYGDGIARLLRLININGTAKRTRERATKYQNRGWLLVPESESRLAAAEKVELETGTPAGSEYHMEAIEG